MAPGVEVQKPGVQADTRASCVALRPARECCWAVQPQAPPDLAWWTASSWASVCVSLEPFTDTLPGHCVLVNA